MQRLVRRLASTRIAAAVLARVLAPADLWVARRSAGRRTIAETLVGLPIVELTTLGARTGIQRTVPLVALVDGSRFVVFGSSWGRRRPPGWHYNLRAHPAAIVTRHGRAQPVRARETAGEEREAYWARAVGVYEGYAQYEQRAGRRVPVWVLEPSPAADRFLP